MFALVALLCFYAATNNIKKAFKLAPFSRWTGFNWLLFGMGVLLILVGIRCTWQASKDFEAKKREAEKKIREDTQKRQQQFFFDREDSPDTAENDEFSSPAESTDDK